MINTLVYPGIKNINFSDINLVINLSNDRVLMIPLEKFPTIKNLSAQEKKLFEIIDDNYLSFLAIDEVFSLEELIGLSR